MGFISRSNRSQNSRTDRSKARQQCWGAFTGATTDAPSHRRLVLQLLQAHVTFQLDLQLQPTHRHWCSCTKGQTSPGGTGARSKNGCGQSQASKQHRLADRLLGQGHPTELTIRFAQPHLELKIPLLQAFQAFIQAPREGRSAAAEGPDLNSMLSFTMIWKQRFLNGTQQYLLKNKNIYL